MRDLHNHILYGIDDGSETLRESINIIEKAANNGYTDLILTPHFRWNQEFTCDNKEKQQIFNILQDSVKEKGININLYLGNEVTIDYDVFNYLENDQVMSLNNSRYILIELPFDGKLEGLDRIIDKFLARDYIPVIAHPERYNGYNINDYEALINRGVLFQGNMSTLYKKYGDKAQRTLETMLKRHMIHFICSDVHGEHQQTYDRINGVVEKLIELTGSKKIAYDLVEDNAAKVINNEVIKPYYVLQVKRSLKLFNMFK